MFPKKYRQAVSVLVLKPTEVCVPGRGCEMIHHVLLLHKPRIHDAWQLPQGGIEPGETAEQTAVRETQEEAGITLGVALHCNDATYSYDFPPEFTKRYSPVNDGQQLCFVAFLVPKDTVVRVDRNEVDAHVWITPEQLSQYLSRKEYREIVERVLAESKEKLKRDAM